jgi:hypothetical protein
MEEVRCSDFVADNVHGLRMTFLVFCFEVKVKERIKSHHFESIFLGAIVVDANPVVNFVNIKKAIEDRVHGFLEKFESLTCRDG